MGIIGRFIDDACRNHPPIMRKVLDRQFGDLGEWINFDEEGEACGCLIGTIAISAGCRFMDKTAKEIDVWELDMAIRTAASVGGRDYNDGRRVGIQVHDAAMRISGAWNQWCTGRLPTAEADAVMSEMLKRRIARSLGVTYASATRPAETAGV